MDNSTDFSKVDCLFIVVADNNWTWTWAWATIGKTSYSTNDGVCEFSFVGMGSDVFTSGSYVNSHEGGHALLGLNHEEGENTEKYGCDYKGNGQGGQKSPFSVMGNEESFLSAYIQYMLGWIPKEKSYFFF